MANLPESALWDAGIYQLEEADVVQGGVNGIDNKQAKSLANRTLWLKGQVESAGTSLAAHLIAADPHAQYTTAPELAAALMSFAPLANPCFTGDPKAPTPSQFDSDTSLATTAFVQRAIGNFSGLVGSTGPLTLTAADAGKRVVGENTTVTLPATGAIAPGSAFSVFAYGVGGLTVQCSGSDTISPGGGISGLASYFVPSGTECTFTSENGRWVVSGTGALLHATSFASSLSGNGYQKLPSGLIVQWGNSGSIPAGSQVTISLPITMPAALQRVFALAETATSDTTPISGGWSAVSQSQFTLRNKSSAAAIFSWMAIGY